MDREGGTLVTRGESGMSAGTQTPNVCDVQVALTLADQLVRAGRIDDALTQYRWCAAGFRARGETSNALSVYLLLGSLSPCCTRTQIECADFYVEVGRLDDALAIYDWAEQAYRAAGMPAAAALVMRRAVEAAPEHHERRVRLSELYVQLGRTDEAIQVYHGAAQGFFAAARTQEYLWVAQQILALDPEHLPTLRDATRVQLYLRDVSAVSEHLRTIFRVAPSDEVGGELLAETLALLGRPRDAARIARRVARARLKARNHDWRIEARRIIERALQWDPTSEELHKLRSRLDEDTRAARLRSSLTEHSVTGVFEFIGDAMALSDLADPDHDPEDIPTDIRRNRRSNDDVTKRERGPSTDRSNVVPFPRVGT